jgi:hypothetical protein
MSRVAKVIAIGMVALVAAGLADSARAQGLTGQISGAVVDSSKGVMPGVTVTVKNVNTQVTRDAVTDGAGVFVITNLLAGTYDVKASLTGFKVFEQKGVILTAADRLALPAITLEVGGLEETVSVSGESPRIQTKSGERSAVISGDELVDRGLKGRDPLGTLMTLPGVIDTTNRDAPGSTGGLSINGQTSIAFAYDGITSKDTGSNGGNFARPALDSIAELKLQSSNFQAEYGRSSGATIVVVTKSGSRNFRGSFAYFRRDDALNSNSWERERDCAGGQAASCKPPEYKYNNTTYTIGGPVILPKFNKNRDKLFFFWSHDMLPRTDPGTLQQMNMPTALQRAGDFSQTRDSQGRPVFIKDPSIVGGTCNVTTGVGNACFSGNVIPSFRINPLAAVMLNPTLLPLPNTTDLTGRNQYNYTFQNFSEHRGTHRCARLQHQPDDHVLHAVSVRSNTVKKCSSSLGSSGSGGWPQFYSSRHDTTESMVNTFHTLTPHMVMEVTFGINCRPEHLPVNPDGGMDSRAASRNQRSAMPGLPRLFDGSANPYDIIPNISWAGTNALPNTPDYRFENRYPFTARDDIHNLSTNLTWLRGAHNVKVGLFMEWMQRPASRASSFNGSFSFNAATENPLDSNFGLANLLLGNLNSYTESNIHPYAQGRYHQYEFFVQDNWRLHKNFTFDYGMRFYYIGSTFVAGQDTATFDPTAYSQNSAVELYQATCSNGAATCSGATRVALNPAGGTLPAFFIGKVIPGSGDLTNGMVIKKQTPYEGVFRPAPRINFAWDMTGDGKTAVRGGAGVFYDRYGDDTILRLIEPEPLVTTRTYNFVNIGELATASPVNSLLTNARGFSQAFTPHRLQLSIGVQRELPWKIAADVAYVGNTGGTRRRRSTSTGSTTARDASTSTRRRPTRPAATPRRRTTSISAPTWATRGSPNRCGRVPTATTRSRCRRGAGSRTGSRSAPLIQARRAGRWGRSIHSIGRGGTSRNESQRLAAA